MGVMRTAVVDESLLTDGVPVDTCANLVLAAAWRAGRDGPGGAVMIYNHTSGGVAPLTWGEIYRSAVRHLEVKLGE